MDIENRIIQLAINLADTLELDDDQGFCEKYDEALYELDAAVARLMHTNNLSRRVIEEEEK